MKWQIQWCCCSFNFVRSIGCVCFSLHHLTIAVGCSTNAEKSGMHVNNFFFFGLMFTCSFQLCYWYLFARCLFSLICFFFMQIFCASNVFCSLHFSSINAKKPQKCTKYNFLFWFLHFGKENWKLNGRKKSNGKKATAGSYAHRNRRKGHSHTQTTQTQSITLRLIRSLKLEPLTY